MTEEQIKELGFELTEQYKHDAYHTNRYRLDCMMVEFTYEGEELLTTDLTITELIGLLVTLDQVKALTEIIVKTHK